MDLDLRKLRYFGGVAEHRRSGRPERRVPDFVAVAAQTLGDAPARLAAVG